MTHSVAYRDVDSAMGVENAQVSQRSRPVRWVLARWPAFLGLAVMVSSLPIDAPGSEPWPILLIPVVVYLAAAALARPTTAWPLCAAATAVVFVAPVIGVDVWWGLVMAALAFFFTGVANGLFRPGSDLFWQSFMLVVLGGAAIAAVYVDARVGAVLVAAGLLAHGAWDIVLHRRNRTVPRSLSEFCAVLDITLGIGILLLTFVI